MRRQILLSITIRFLIYFTHWLVLAYLPLLLKGYGLSDLQIGMAIGLFSLSSMALMLPLGMFSDFFSPRRTMLCGALLYAGYFAALLSARSFAWILGAVCVGGLGSAALVVVSESLYLKHFGQIQRSRRVATYQLSAYLGFGLGPLVGGLLVQTSPELIFVFAMAGAGAIFLFSLLLLDYEPIVFSFKDYSGDVFRLKPLLLIACLFVLSTHFGVEQTSYSLLLKEKFGLLPRQIGLVFACMGLWMAMAVPLVGRYHDKRRSVFLFFLGGMAFSSLFQMLTPLAVDIWSLVIIRLLHTLGDTVAMLELGVLVALLFPSARLGGNSGLLYGVRTLATFLAAVTAGSLNREWGYGASFFASGLFVLCFVVGCVAFIGFSAARRQAVGWQGVGK